MSKVRKTSDQVKGEELIRETLSQIESDFGCFSLKSLTEKP